MFEIKCKIGRMPRQTASQKRDRYVGISMTGSQSNPRPATQRPRVDGIVACILVIAGVVSSIADDVMSSR